MGSTMKTNQQHFKKGVFKALLALVAMASLFAAAPVTAQAGHVGWAVSVGGGYGGGWRPAAYGPGWGPGWRGGYYGPDYGYPYAAGYYSAPIVYAAPPVVAYVTPQPMVLAAQPQAPVWYYCQSSGQYFPYVQNCASGWQTQPAMPPSSNASPRQRNNN
jgi:hypothetical protein